MTNNSLFAALYRGYYEAANDNSRVALLEYFVPVISRWNIQWGDGTLDPFSNQIIKFVHSNEKHFLKYFGKGTKLVYVTYSRNNGVYFSIAALANFNFDLLPSPDIIVERSNGRQYYLYRLEDYDTLEP